MADRGSGRWGRRHPGRSPARPRRGTESGNEGDLEVCSPTEEKGGSGRKLVVGGAQAAGSTSGSNHRRFRDQEAWVSSAR
jgi:hypothetical protein